MPIARPFSLDSIFLPLNPFRYGKSRQLISRTRWLLPIYVPSEFVSRPKLRVIDVPAWRGLLQELAGKEDSVIGLQIGMTIDLPSRLNAGPVSDEPCAAVARRHQQKAGNCIDAVVQAFPPLHDHIGRNRHAARKLRLKPRMHVDEIDWAGPGIRQHAEVVSNRKYRTEGAQRGLAGIVSAGNISLHADARSQWRGGKAVACIRCEGPSSNSVRTETAELPHALVVEIPIVFLCRRWTPEPRAQSVAVFRRCSAIVCGGLSIQAQIVAIE